MLQDDTLLLESDLIFEESILKYLLDNPYPSLALVAKFESWMDGTVVELSESDEIKRFLSKKEFRFEDIPHYYKTVNIYKFSREFSSTHYIPFLEAYSKALGNNEYYEQVLKVITLLEKPDIKAVRIKDEAWYEIDDVQDLNIAESIFADRKEKLHKFQTRYGGYWRYPHMLDFCYLVNPFFPNPKMMAEIKANFERLLCNYPSGMDVNSLLMAKYFGLDKQNVVVGNGAAELIKSLMSLLNGKIGICLPTFEEYPNRYLLKNVVTFQTNNADFSYTANDLMEYFTNKDITNLVLINPDNPSGNLIEKRELIRLASFTREKKIQLIIDESFVDFADTDEWQSLLYKEFIEQNPHVIVVKSISKSFGVPGLRLGVLASGNKELISTIKKDVAIWNINSFGEFFLQIWEKYASEYREAIREFKEVRRLFIDGLRSIPFLRVIPSHANFLLCQVMPPITAKQLTEDLLCDSKILIKDLSSKKGFDQGEYIRIAVRDTADNELLLEALRRYSQ